MIDHTPFWYIFIITCIVLLQSVAPLSIAYSAYLILLRPGSYRLPTALEYWVLAETLFYVVFYPYRRYYLELPGTHPPPPSLENRRKLVEKCLLNIPDPEKYISIWFLGASVDDIKRDNVKDFLSWAFFNAGTADPAFDDELEEYTQKFEQKLGRKFRPSRSNVKCLRLSVDNANIPHRSLWWYFCVYVVDVLVYIYLVFHKFRLYQPSFPHAFSTIPPRSHTLMSTYHSPSKALTYWYRPQISSNKLPVLFIHGVGIGLYPYAKCLKEISEQLEVEIIAVEMLHISSRLGRGAPSKDEFFKQILIILNHHGFDKVVLVSHSFGTFITTQLLHCPQLADRIASVIMVDPVSMLLHLPDLAFNFMIRKPIRANEWQLNYFGSKDPGTAHTFSRRFFWSESILWKEDIAHSRVTVFLGERDMLVNTTHIYNYLLGLNDGGAPVTQNGAKHSREYGKSSVDPAYKQLKVIWCPDLDHGQLFDSERWRGALLQEVFAHCSAGNVSPDT